MIIKSFEAEQFRNLNNLKIEPCEGVNILCGENGQGKTNIIEGIWLFTGFKSFRTWKVNELIPHGKDYCKTALMFYGENRNQEFSMNFSKDTQNLYKNGVKMRSSRAIIGEFFSVVFSPTHLNLIKGGPDEKRKFVDIAISQLKPSYARLLSDYYRCLKERNALLKNFSSDFYDETFIETWDENLSQLGGKIITERKNYIEKLKEASQNFYMGISGGKEKISLNYVQTGREKIENSDDVSSILFQLLKESRETDFRMGITTKGPHRDNIDIKLDGMNIKSYGSQGQQRSAALSLKLGEAYIVNEFKGERPVALLDDVMSELDVNRQNFILNELKDWQVFITCCEPTQVLRMKSGKSFTVENGKIV